MKSMAPTRPNTNRYPILDALRFILAFWVVMAHFGPFPLFFAFNENTRIGYILVSGWHTLPFGTAAVIGFFVISGFCIHLPFRDGGSLPIGRYYARRYTRILIPLAGALLCLWFAGIPIHFVGQGSILWSPSVLWSLLCEEIYYAIYPLLRVLRQSLGWTPLLSAAFVLGCGIALTHRYAGDWVDYGPMGTAFILLPIWLLGALLAEQVEHLTPLKSTVTIWQWRFGVWAASWVCEMLHFKIHVSYTQTMIPFGVLACLWIRQEIRYGMFKPPWAGLASAGGWSYSLYLIHGPAMYIFAKRLLVPNLGPVGNWCLAYAFILTASYIFFRLVERPSHRLARRISLRPSAKARVVEQTA
jgi:peptidoglycan/LPS O-acetylase OafA/YrhL